MKLKYFIIKGKKKYSSIYLRFWDGKRIDQKTSTGFSIIPNDWSEKKERLKIKANATNSDFINNELENLERHIIDSYNKDFNSREHISKTWVKEKVRNYFGRVSENENYKIYFVDWVEKFVETAPKRLHNGKPIKPRSINNYKSALDKLKGFEDHQKKKYRFEHVDLNFHRDFIFYCQNIEKLSNNTIGSHISRVKTFCRNIELEGYPINPNFKNREFSIPTTETVDVYLNEEEINKIYHHDFKASERLENARDLFIIGLRTGLRISDFLRIKKENILGNVINITTTKTSQNLTIPIHPQFKEILAKRKGEFPNKISDQKFNLYIKEICGLVEINELTFGSILDKTTKRKKNGTYPKYKLISSHSCRRSFATNLFLDGIENSIIMKATGHKSPKQFMAYIKASKDEHIKKISDYWDLKYKKDV